MLLDVNSLSVQFSSRVILQDISFGIEPNEIVALLGRNGCGKTTLLNAIAGQVDGFSGTIKKPQTVAYATQNSELLPWRTALGNVCLPFEFQNYSQEVARQKARAALKEFGLIEFENLKPDHMSGGTRQKIIIVRTICSRAALLLLDEPFSNLDVRSWPVFGNLIRKNTSEVGGSALVVTHLLSAALIANRIVVLGDRPARVVKQYRNAGDGVLVDFESGQKFSREEALVQFEALME